MKRRILSCILLGMFILTSCANASDAGASTEQIADATVADAEEEEQITSADAEATDTGEEVETSDADVQPKVSETDDEDEDAIRIEELLDYYEDEDAYTDYDHNIVSGYMNLSQEDFDNVSDLEEYDPETNAVNGLFIVKLADYQDDEITVYGVKEGIIISYKSNKQFFPCGWQDITPSHKIGLCDMDGDGSRELVLATNTVHGNGVVINREVLRVFMFDDNDEITMLKLSEENVAGLLKDMIRYDTDKQSVIVKNSESVAQEIPLTAFERSYWNDDPDKPLEEEIEYIDYVNAWWYDVTDEKVSLKLNIRLGGENLFFGLLPLDENEEIIDSCFSVVLKDNVFNLDCVQK